MTRDWLGRTKMVAKNKCRKSNTETERDVFGCDGRMKNRMKINSTNVVLICYLLLYYLLVSGTVFTFLKLNDKLL